MSAKPEGTEQMRPMHKACLYVWWGSKKPLWRLNLGEIYSILNALARGLVRFSKARRAEFLSPFTANPVVRKYISRTYEPKNKRIFPVNTAGSVLARWLQQAISAMTLFFIAYNGLAAVSDS